MAKKRMTKRERLCREFCEMIRENGDFTFEVEWYQSKTWGHCTRVRRHDETLTVADGCGYDKLSAALSAVLRYLPGTDEGQLAVERTHAAGFDSVKSALLAHGWELTRVFSGRSSDVFTVRCLREVS